MKRAISVVLAVVMLCGLLSVSVLAAEPESVKAFRNEKTTQAAMAQGGFCALQEDGRLWGGGALALVGDMASHNDNGADGVITLVPRVILEKVSSFAVGDRGIGAIQNDGSLWMAENEEANSNAPLVFKKKMDDVSQIGVSVYHVLAVKKDGSLWSWGLDWHGELGIGDQIPNPSGEFREMYETNTPFHVMDDVRQVATQGMHSVVLKEDGTVWAWGNNAYGQVGTGKMPDLSSLAPGAMTLFIGEGPQFERTPVKVMDGAKAVFAGERCSLAIKEDNSLWIWGYIPYGAADNCQPSPIKVMDNVQYVAAVDRYNSNNSGELGLLILKTDGSLCALGKNKDGALGDGGSGEAYDKISRSEPHAVSPLLSGAVAISIYGSSGLVVKSDGSLWGFGSNKMYKTQRVYRPFDTVNESVLRVPVQLAGSAASQPNERPSVPPVQSAVAKPTASKILLDGKAVSLDAYNISGNNYCKIRDVAMLINGTGKQFEVTWDKSLQAVSMVSNHAYTTVGGELAKGNGESKTATLNTAKIYLDGKEVALTAYNIGGNNYIKLRDLGQAFDFDVRWDGAASAIVVDTTKGYTG